MPQLSSLLLAPALALTLLRPQPLLLSLLLLLLLLFLLLLGRKIGETAWARCGGAALVELEAKEDMEETVPGAEEAYGLETFLGGDVHEGFMVRWR